MLPAIIIYVMTHNLYTVYISSNRLKHRVYKNYKDVLLISIMDVFLSLPQNIIE